MATLKELEEIRYNYLSKNWEYERCYYTDFNYQVLKNCIYRKSHKFSDRTFNDVTLMLDTETSKPEYDLKWNIDEINDIRSYVEGSKYKWHPAFKDVATKQELALVGIKFGGSRSIDSLYQELQEQYDYIFEDVENDIDALDNIYSYLINNQPEEHPLDNHVVIWTLSIRLLDLNIATLYGRKPSELIDCLNRLLSVLDGDMTYLYVFNLPYDYVFLRKFFNRDFGFPIKQLNVKPHYPISLEYENGLIIKDALILAQRKLEKWAEDLGVEHQKASGSWNYDIRRHQNTHLTDEEIHYAEYDTLAGVECIDALRKQLNKNIGTMPLTATGILRELIKKIGAANHAKKWFWSCCPTWEQYQKLVKIYHGGYTHGNRHHLNELIDEFVKGYDFASSYPFCLFKKYPCGHFVPIANKSKEYIIRNSDDYAFMFKFRAYGVELKDDSIPMPYLQFSKAETINDITDNGRIIAADYVEIWLNEIDLKIIDQQYNIKKCLCTDVEVAAKDYLPRWFTDVVFDLFKDKCTLKGVDKVLYQIQKAKLNACYGLCSQRWDKVLILEDEDGSYYEDASKSAEDIFNETIKKRSVVLPYFVGVWCTSYACENLFKLGSMCDTWLYSDTDSCYGLGWHEEEVAAYNKECIDFMIERDYGAVEYKGKVFNLGVAENDDDSNYLEFQYMGAKRYAGRCAADKQIHITVAGVPKEKGALCLNDDMKSFYKYFTFRGEITGKKLHTHIYVDDIYINEYGDEVGDSIDLSPCDYKLGLVTYHSLDDYIEGIQEITIDVPDDTDELELII